MRNPQITDPHSPTHVPQKGFENDPRVDDDIPDPSVRSSDGGDKNPAPLEFPNEEKTPANIPEKS